MKVFVTGATGFVGSAVVKDLLEAGHDVTGLARNEEGAKKLQTMGARVHRGDLTDIESIKSGVQNSEGVIHCGFIHDFSNFPASCETDRKVILEMGKVLRGSQRPLIITSGIGLLSGIKNSVETAKPLPTNKNPRIASEEAARVLMEEGLYVSVVRLPPSVHGEGDHGFVPILINMAREKGVSGYLNEGQNKWPAVHRYDAARLFRLALEKGAQSAFYHAAAETGIPFKDIASVIGEKLNVEVEIKTGEKASEYFSWFQHFAAMDCSTSSEETKKVLGWNPKEIGLLEDMRKHYF